MILDEIVAVKRREIELVAQEYLVRHRLEGVDVRFDVLALTVGPEARITHLEDAWRPEARR